MRITRRIWWQLAILAVVATTAFAFMALGYLRLPNLLFGIGHYTVTVQLPDAAGLYERANVTYRGSEVGQVEHVTLTDTGVDAQLSLRSDVEIPADLHAEVHSTSAVGEQYVALLPNTARGPALQDGDVIPASHTSVPPAFDTLLDATNRGLQAIPNDNLRTVIDESDTAFGGLGPDIRRLVQASSTLSVDTRAHLDELANVIDNVGPVLDTQTDTATSVQAWAAHLAAITGSLRDHDGDVRGILHDGAAAAGEVRKLFDRLQPTVPILLANLVTVGGVAVTYRADLEQLLVLLPQGVGDTQAAGLANRATKQAYKGAYLSFKLNLNLPPPCTTGFLPVQQQRIATEQDYPDRPAGDLYCRVPQDSPFNVRGARNIPCETRPGKRAPTVKMCESDENYVPLNDGLNWKGDPNGTSTGQAIPQLPPPPASTVGAGAPTAAPAPIAVAEYDPATGSYIGPDGHPYTQADLAHPVGKDRTWQTMLLPPPN